MPSSAAARAAADSAGTGHDDWAGSPTIVQDAARPRRPTIRHCIGVRSCASSTSTCANGSSSIRCVGGAQARPDGAYSRSAAVISSCMSGRPRAARSSSRSRSSSVRAGHVAERVAQLVEQRHVLDRRRDRAVRAAAPRLHEQPLLLGRRARRRRPGQELRVAQPAEHLGARRAAATRPREVEEVLVRRASRRRTPRGRGRGRARRGPGATSRRAGRSRPAAAAGCAGPATSAGGAPGRAAPRSSTITSSRQKTRNSVRAAGRLLPGGAPHQLGHPGRALDVGDGRLVVAGRRGRRRRPRPASAARPRSRRGSGSTRSM